MAIHKGLWYEKGSTPLGFTAVAKRSVFTLLKHYVLGFLFYTIVKLTALNPSSLRYILKEDLVNEYIFLFLYKKLF